MNRATTHLKPHKSPNLTQTLFSSARWLVKGMGAKLAKQIQKDQVPLPSVVPACQPVSTEANNTKHKLPR